MGPCPKKEKNATSTCTPQAHKRPTSHEVAGKNSVSSTLSKSDNLQVQIHRLSTSSRYIFDDKCLKRAFVYYVVTQRVHAQTGASNSPGGSGQTSHLATEPARRGEAAQAPRQARRAHVEHCQRKPPSLTNALLARMRKGLPLFFCVCFGALTPPLFPKKTLCAAMTGKRGGEAAGQAQAATAVETAP